ncbi:DUF2169 family type VI secretion system accessory protein, partial [Chondromyces apiculatus]|uniref:DUF2169 family type VI secretion system accessory protein n=1 Tax=Chondromyces apiculatus TaxID=51 RepID=UPI0012DD0627
MAGETSRSVEVVPVGQVAAATVLWRMSGQLAVTVVVKATFDLVPDGEMELTEPEPIVTAEVHHGGSPVRSVLATSDLAPFLPRADVVLTGHAHAPEGRSVGRQVVRLSVYREQALLDKTLFVHGDRTSGEPAPFQSMPLVYERAFGGIGWADNPLGVGSNPQGQAARPPNIEVPRKPGVTGGFGPISRAWLARRRLVSALDRKVLEAPIVELPETFDWTYYQAAPLDQRVPYLVGDEWIELEGMHPVLQSVQSCLPGAFAEARLSVDGHPGSGQVVFRADTLRIDADQGRCSVVWRAVVPVVGEEALAKLRILVGVGTRDRPIAWPEEPAPAAGKDAAAWRAIERTVLLSTGGALREAARIVDAEENGDAALRVTPGRLAMPAETAMDVTLDVAPEKAAAAPIPFQAMPQASGPQGGAPIPGAPWSGMPAGRVPAGGVSGDEHELTITYTPLEIAAMPPPTVSPWARMPARRREESGAPAAPAAPAA